jgi:hypothetical protein
MKMVETVVYSTKQSVDQIKEILVKSATPKRSQIAHVESLEEILRKFAKEKDLYEKEHRHGKESAQNQSVRKLFSTKGDTTPIIVTKTPLGYKLDTSKGKESRSKLIGANIPKVLTIFFI